MHLTDLQSDRLRNLKQVDLDLPTGLIVVAGRNAQGKTSLLESVYLLSTGRSFRTRNLDELIAWEGGPLRVAGVSSNRLGQSKLAVLMESGSRRLLADGVEKDLEAYLGRLHLVDLTLERMNVLRGGPLERRRFLDRGIVGLRPDYLRAIGEYRRVLQHRNALLRRPGREQSLGPQLDAWDERLRIAATLLHHERRGYARRLEERLGDVANRLFHQSQELHLRYRPSPAETEKAPADRFGELFQQCLERVRSRDLALGHTSHGPHRDELLVELAGVDLRRFGSAGQVRAAMIAFKLAKLALLREERGEAPLFLMDDFDTDLDEVRASELAGFLHEGGFQALVATSKETLVGRLGVPFTQVHMDNGVAHAA